MITQDDLRTLRRHRTVSGKVVEWLLVFAPLVMVVLANLNIRFASYLAADSGYSFGELIGVWFHGVENSTLYRGTFVMSIDLFRTALIQLLSSVVFLCVAYLHIKNWKMNERIIAVLDEQGALGEGDGDTREKPIENP